MENKILSVKRVLSGKFLFFMWVFTLVIPVVMANFSITWLFRTTEDSNASFARSKLILECEMFREEVRVENYLERKLKEFFAKYDSQLADASPEKIRNILKSEIGGEIAGVIVHGKDTNDFEISLSSFCRQRLAAFPKVFTRRFLQVLSSQNNCEFFDSNLKRKMDLLNKTGKWEKIESDAISYVRRQFGLIAEIPIFPEKVAWSVSARLNSSVYFFYKPIYEEKKGRKFVSRGYFFFIRGTSISGLKLLKDSLKPMNSQLIRSITHLNHEINDIEGYKIEKISSFSRDLNGSHLTFTLPQSLLTHLAQSGSFFPGKIFKLCRKMPLLRVSLPASALKHPLEQYYSGIKFLSSILAILGTILFIRVALFGLEIPLSIRTKVISALIFIVCLPVCMLIVSYSTYLEFNMRFNQAELEDHMKQRLESMNKAFTGFSGEQQNTCLKIKESIEKILKTNPDQKVLKTHLEKVINSGIAQDAFIFDTSNRVIHVSNNSARLIGKIDPDEDSHIKLLTKALINIVESDGKINNGNRAEVLALANESFYIDARFGNIILNSCGRIMKLGNFSNGTKYSTLKIIHPLTGRFYGLLVIRFTEQMIVNAFIESWKKEPNRLSAGNFEQNLKDYFFVFTREDENLKFDEHLYTEIADFNRYRPMLELANKISSSIFWTDKFNDILETAYIRYFAEEPFLVLTLANKSIAKHPLLYAIIAILVYLLGLFIFIFYLFGQIYLMPINEFTKVSRAIGEGQRDCFPQIDAEDEFGELARSFEKMIIGLEQKEKLSQFVSGDVLKALETNDDAGLRPGGEKIEATVLFAGVPILVNSSENSSIAEKMRLLNLSISIAEEVAIECGGILDKVIENTFMIVFRASIDETNHAILGAEAALLLRKRFLSAGLSIESGLATGIVVSGRIGSKAGKLDFTVIGDTVNLASRLKSLAGKATETSIIVAPSSIRKLRGRGRVRFIERIPIKGKSREYPLYELLDIRQVNNA